jgi:hypothetical protein
LIGREGRGALGFDLRAFPADGDAAGGLSIGATLSATAAEAVASAGAEPAGLVDESATAALAVRSCFLDRNQPTRAAINKHPPIAAKAFLLLRTRVESGVGFDRTTTVGAS